MAEATAYRLPHRRDLGYAEQHHDVQSTSDDLDCRLTGVESAQDAACQWAQREARQFHRVGSLLRLQQLLVDRVL